MYTRTFGKKFNGYRDGDKDPASTILSLTNFGLSINLELVPTADPDWVFGVLNNVINRFRNLEVLPDREL